MKSYHLQNMDGPRGCWAKQNKSDRKRQIPHDFIYMWNLKNEINEHTKQKQTHREQSDDSQREGGLEAWL